jgi:hypothetical protein
MLRFMAALLIAAFMLGCGSIPKTPWQWHDALVATYSAGLRSLVDLREAGKIGDEDWADIKAAKAVAKAALDGLHEALLEGNQLSIGEALEVAQKAVAALLAWQDQVKGGS